MKKECLQLLEDITKEHPELEMVCGIMMQAIANTQALEKIPNQVVIDHRVVAKITQELLFCLPEWFKRNYLYRGERYRVRPLSYRRHLLDVETMAAVA